MMTETDLAAFQASVLDDPLTQDVWREKYRHGGEATIAESRARVVAGVFEGAKDGDHEAFAETFDLVQRGIFVPAGRVQAGAGTDRRVTLLNCFVNETVQDSMAGINRAVARAALTMQQGGGIGTDFSTVRPRGALVRRTGSVSSGVIPFMDQMDAMCSTVVSGGNRRGAMMATLRDDHPDLWNPGHLVTGTGHDGRTFLTTPSFVSAKRQPGRLTQFNVSVLVSDAFLGAVADGADWDLGFHVPRADGEHVAVYDRPFPYDAWEIDEDLQPATDQDGVPEAAMIAKGTVLSWYVYRRVPARRLWDEILRSTYVYAEPGVIFIDRVNKRNNLRYMEDIRSTNPCGEQPLPPDNVCCLGSVNLAFLVAHPFTPRARFDVTTYHRAIRAGVRFLDDVLNATRYPLEAQRAASMNTRRIGLGVTGFGDALVQLGVRYGSEESVRLARRLAQVLQVESYAASARLAAERGPFPAYDRVKFLSGYNAGKLPGNTMDLIRANGIRNGVLNTIAPNGTISLYVGNVSSGHEPVFSFRPATRKVRQPDGTTRGYEVVPYSLRLFRYLRRDLPKAPISVEGVLPPEFVGALDLTPEEHLVVHGAWQEHIDAAVSKTVNCPASMTFDDFRAVYDRAYALGAKGVTTYRPDPASGRGAVLSEAEIDAGRKAVDGFIASTLKKGDLVVGRCPGCNADVWVHAGETRICDNCGKRTLVEMTKEEAQASYTGAMLAEAGTAAAPADTAPPAPEAASGPQNAPEEPAPARADDDSDAAGPPPRPAVLDGRTHKVKWPVDGVNWYVTVTNDGRRPRELFVTGGDPDAREWVEALARTATAVLRRDGDVRFLADELERVASARGGAFIDRVYRPSVVAAIGGVLRAEIERLRIGRDIATAPEIGDVTSEQWVHNGDGYTVTVVPAPGVTMRTVPEHRIIPSGWAGEACPKCGEPTLVREAGCLRCLDCGFERCG